VTDVAAFAALVPGDHGLCVLSTTRADGSVQSSVVNAGVLHHPVTGDDVVGLVAAGGARKLAHLVLRDVFRAAGGTHDDWDAYDRAMADERRAAVLITPTRTYTTPGTDPG
jgi:hypothetical protein